MSTECDLLNNILRLREKTKSTQFVGAETIELLKDELAKLNLNVSNIDVFVEVYPTSLTF